MFRKSLLLLAACATLLPVPVEAAGAELTAPADAIVVRYEVRGRGNTSSLADLATAAAETYADPRGWSAGGALQFVEVSAGADFTLWLAADAQMPTFGGACDHVWSCRSGNNVVVNEDRWLGASPAWNDLGGSLRDYRHMVVNHETGHWLLQGHQFCGGSGQQAPVMQQQSMGLQGCTANPWPLTAEHQRMQSGERIRSLRARRSVVVQAGAVESEARSVSAYARCEYVPLRTTRELCF